MNKINIRRIISSGMGIVACLIGMFAGSSPARALSSIGINIPWLVNGSMNYGHDFASANYNATFAHQVLDDIAARRFNMVRVWAFEGLQGLNMSGTTITGVDPGFLNDVDDFVAYANKDGIDVEVVCFNYADIDSNPSMITNYGNMAGMTNACVSLDSKLASSNLLYQIDICNEGNLAAEQGGIGWQCFHDFIYNTTHACHAVSARWVTMSDQNSDDFGSNFYNEIGGVGCDYYEFHQYSEAASLPASNSDGKPMELGEFGPPSPGGWNQDAGNFNDWQNVIDSFNGAASQNSNYFSSMAWCYFQDGEGYGMSDGNADGSWNNAGWTMAWWAQYLGI